MYAPALTRRNDSYLPKIHIFEVGVGLKSCSFPSDKFVTNADLHDKKGKKNTNPELSESHFSLRPACRSKCGSLVFLFMPSSVLKQHTDSLHAFPGLSFRCTHLYRLEQVIPNLEASIRNMFGCELLSV